MATYYVWSGASGAANGSSWTDAYLTLATVFGVDVAGDTIYVAHDHVENNPGTINFASAGTSVAPVTVTCVDRAGSVPPVKADRRTTAVIGTSGGFNINVLGPTFIYGMIFRAGDSTPNASCRVQVANGWVRFDYCSLRLGNTGTTSQIVLGTGASRIELNETSVQFGHINQFITMAADVRWRNVTIPFMTGGVIPTNVFNGNGALLECIGLDLSAFGAGKVLSYSFGGDFSIYNFVDCKIDPAVTIANAPFGIASHKVYALRSGAGPTNFAIFYSSFGGELREETTIIRAGGASDGVTPIAWKMTTDARVSYLVPFESPPIAIWNDTIGSAVTATVEGVWDSGVVPNNDECWLDLSYIASATQPQGSIIHDGKEDFVDAAAAQASSSETWGGSTTKFKLGVTFTPQQKGWIYGKVKAAKPSSTFFIDPLVTLS